jgi:PHP domain-containing protein
MPLTELICNFHMHTPYSDGEIYHAEIAQAALSAGLDCIYVTDHNVWVNGLERYHEKDGRRLLLLVGEEVHDQARQPQRNHLLVFGARTELAGHAPRPQALIDAASAAGGLTFLAHPVDPPVALLPDDDLSWVTWEISGYTGLELWNYMTSFKALLTSRSAALRYAYNPELGIAAPPPQVLKHWDELIALGQRVVAIGGADAHGHEYRAGRIRRVLFPYEFLFRQVNTHVLVQSEPAGDVERDRHLVLDALAAGHCFVAYDGAAPARGFRFSANSDRGTALMGDEVVNRTGLTLQFAAPSVGSLRLLRDGAEIGRWDNQTHSSYTVAIGEHGVYRVEVHVNFKGRLRGWIYSNPIYVRAPSE